MTGAAMPAPLDAARPVRARLAQARRTLALAAALRAAAIAVAVACGLLVIVALLDAFVGLPMPLRRSALPLATASPTARAKSG